MAINGHEYCVQNAFNRSHAGRYIYVFAMGISWVAIFILLKFNGELSPLENIIISSLSTGIFFLACYFLFDKWIWKWGLLFHFLKYPDISGEWECVGKTSYQEFDNELVKSTSSEWQGKVTIVQTWDKLRIRMETEHSNSESISAAIIYDEIDSYKVLYSYKNEPKDLDHKELRTHLGFVELQLKKNSKSASAKYYNVSGRRTFGSMQWKKLN